MDYTLELDDQILIEDEVVGRGGNNIRMAFSEIVGVTVTLDGTYKIKRMADTAFMRTNYP